MKATLATVTLVISLLTARLTAADPAPAALSVEQQFQLADVQVAIEQYKKLRMAACDITLKLQTEATLADDLRKQLEVQRERLQEEAEKLRVETIKRATIADLR